MTTVIDTCVLIDVLRHRREAFDLVRTERLSGGRLHANEVTRLEVLAGMRPSEEWETRELLSTVIWHDLDREIAELAAEVGRQWLPRNRGIDAADLAIAATTVKLGARLLTVNVKRFPMFEGLEAPY